MTASSSGATANPVPLRQDARTIGLVGLAHGSSHFFHMLLPPLFPLFIRDFGLSYSDVGLLMTIFFVISGIGQALSGFVVDRIGARPVLFGFETSEEAGACVAAIIGAGIIPVAMEFMDKPAIEICEAFAHAGYPLDAEAMLIIEVEGSPAEIDEQLALIKTIALRHNPLGWWA